jgi:osmotically-inducible protein OsmY
MGVFWKEDFTMLQKLRSILLSLSLLCVLGGCQAMTGETMGQNIDDTTITTTVKAKLAAEKGTTLTRVQVDTNRGVVQLSGVVESSAVRSRAEQITRQVGGVKSVVNNLQVQ